jgi:hypothetical protein
MCLKYLCQSSEKAGAAWLKTDTLYCNIDSAATTTLCADHHPPFKVCSEDFLDLTKEKGFQQHQTYVKLTKEVGEILKRHVAEKKQKKESEETERVAQEGLGAGNTEPLIVDGSMGRTL